ncbi:hypothetical protein V8C86DRAFT_3032168 [Haematococcus lacustris]
MVREQPDTTTPLEPMPMFQDTVKEVHINTSSPLASRCLATANRTTCYVEVRYRFGATKEALRRAPPSHPFHILARPMAHGRQRAHLKALRNSPKAGYLHCASGLKAIARRAEAIAPQQLAAAAGAAPGLPTPPAAPPLAAAGSCCCWQLLLVPLLGCPPLLLPPPGSSWQLLLVPLLGCPPLLLPPPGSSWQLLLQLAAAAGAAPGMLTPSSEQQGATAELNTSSTRKRGAGGRDRTQHVEEGEMNWWPEVFPCRAAYAAVGLATRDYIPALATTMGGKRPSKKKRQQLQKLNASPKAGFKCCPSGLKAQMKKAQNDAMVLRAQGPTTHVYRVLPHAYRVLLH